MTSMKVEVNGSKETETTKQEFESKIAKQILLNLIEKRNDVTVDEILFFMHWADVTGNYSEDVAVVVEKWLQDAKDAGLKLLILSNNTVERVTPFAKMLGLDFEANGKKPLRSGYLRAIKKLGISKKEAIAIGDQIFTYVLGARLCGIHCIFTDPIEPEHTNFFKFKRWAERPILASFERSRRK